MTNGKRPNTKIGRFTAMKSKLNFVLGFVLGAIIFGGTAAFAAGIVANPTTSKVFVNGAEIRADAYNINGSNYFKLRDVGQAMDFAVTWDGANNRILIDSRLPYGLDVPLPDRNAGNNGTATPTPSASPSAGTIPAGHDVRFAPLRTGDVIKTEHIDKAPVSISGEYRVTADCYDVEAKRNQAGVNFCDIPYGAPLPEWRLEWNGFPAVEVRDPETVRYKSNQNDRLDVYNAYEAERMVRAIYAYAKNEPYLWKDSARTIPNFAIVSEYPPDYGKGWFFPWRGGICVEGKVKSLPAGGTIHIYALDVYYNGEFKDTEYWCWN